MFKWFHIPFLDIRLSYRNVLSKKWFQYGQSQRHNAYLYSCFMVYFTVLSARCLPDFPSIINISIFRAEYGSSMFHKIFGTHLPVVRPRLNCDGSRAETRFHLSAKRTSPFKSAGRQFNRLLAAEVYASAVVMLDTPCSEVVWWVLATHSIRQFPFHFPSHASPCVITFQLDSTIS